MQTSGMRCVCLFGVALPMLAQMAASLTPSLPAPQPVGTTVTWTASVSSSSAGPFSYRFTVAESGRTPEIVKDFSPDPTLAWTPSRREGAYVIGVTARDNATSLTAAASASFDVFSRVSGPPVATVVSPLVALYSGPPCPEGSSFRVRFSPDNGGGRPRTTPLMACTGDTSMNVYVAGMYPNTAYTLIGEVVSGQSVKSIPAVRLGTGSVDVAIPTVQVTNPSRGAAAPVQDIVFYAALNSPIFATDLEGNVLWYSYVQLTHPMRPIRGGTILASYLSETLADSTFMEIDLAGNILRQTNAARVNEQLPALGIAGTVNGFHHDALKLPNGNYIALAATERVLAGVQGDGDVDVLGDMIIVLDPNLQVIWAWDSFDHLDVHRAAVLGETCAAFATSGCPPVFKAAVANDWLHGNSLSLAPDGNILYSARHQDFVYKIDYQNGTGDGHVIWRLGKDGDFTALSSDPYPWQSHQHDVDFVPGTNVVTLFDNGNTRNAETGGNSRGQVLEIDEKNRTVAYRLNDDLGAFSFALGSAQALSDGGYYFELGAAGPAIGIELSDHRARMKSPLVTYRAETEGFVYRSFRMRSLYSIQ